MSKEQQDRERFLNWSHDFFQALSKIPDLPQELREAMDSVKNDPIETEFDRLGLEALLITEEGLALKQKTKVFCDKMCIELLRMSGANYV